MFILFFILLAIGLTIIVVIDKNRTPILQKGDVLFEFDSRDFTHYDEIELTGVHVDDRKYFLINLCKEKYPVQLRHDIDNKYSDTAVEVKCRDVVVGYLRDYGDLDEIIEVIKGHYVAFIHTMDLDNRAYLTVMIRIYWREHSL